MLVRIVRRGEHVAALAIQLFEKFERLARKRHVMIAFHLRARPQGVFDIEFRPFNRSNEKMQPKPCRLCGVVPAVREAL